MLRFALVLTMMAAAYGTNVQECVRGGSLPLSTVVEGCSEPPCRLPELQGAVVHYTFLAPRDLPSMRTVATVYISMGSISLPIAYDLGQAADTCADLNGASCPVAAEQPLHYTLRMPIHPFFPVGTLVNLELQVVDDEGVLACSRIPVQIVASQTCW